VQTFTARMPLLTATSAFILARSHCGVHLNSVIYTASVPYQRAYSVQHSSTRVSLSLRKVNIQWVLIASPHQENPTILQPHFDLKVDIIKKTEYSIVSYCQMSAGVTRIRGQIRRQIHTQ